MTRVPRSLLVGGLLAAGLGSTLAAQDRATIAAMCEPVLVHCNYAKFYSGTIGWTATLKAPGLDSRGAYEATVTRGKVQCQAKTTDDGEFSGPGLLVVEKPRSSPTDRRGNYLIRVSCPSGPDEEISIDGGLQIDERAAADFALLEGTESYPHPDSDEVNKVTGTMTVRWRLSAAPPAK